MRPGEVGVVRGQYDRIEQVLAANPQTARAVPDLAKLRAA